MEGQKNTERSPLLQRTHPTSLASSSLTASFHQIQLQEQQEISCPRAPSAPPSTNYIESISDRDKNLDLVSVNDLDTNLDPEPCQDLHESLFRRGRSQSLPEPLKDTSKMDAGILTALKSVKNNPYVQYVGLGLAGLVTQKEQHDPATGVLMRKTKLQLVRISAAVCGIELCYAAETAFVSPILLKLGVPASLMTMIWCLSPALGFFLVPIMGSLSDRCKFRIGRRRPFIILMSLGIILGLALVPNGEDLGILLGDTGNETESGAGGFTDGNVTVTPETSDVRFSFSISPEHFRGIILTIVGVTMLDFNCDACQSPCRAYLLDVSVPEDHSTGLTMFTVMAGAGGSVGYIMGGIDWNATSFGEALGGHIRVVFTIVLLAFIVCVISTLTSFKEVPLSQLHVTGEDLQKKKKKVGKSKYRKFTNEDSSSDETTENEYGGIERTAKPISYGAVSETVDISTQNKIETKLNYKSNTAPFENSVPSKQNTIASGQEGGDRLNSSANLKSGSFVRPAQMKSCPDLAAERLEKPAVNLNSATLQAFQHTSVQNISELSHPADRQTQQPNGYASAPLSTHKGKSGVHQNGIPNPQQTAALQSNDVTALINAAQHDEISPYTKHSTGAACDGATQVCDVVETVEVSTDVTLKTYLRSIVRMPRSLWVLCLCNLLCWMSLVCYSLYFTDFVGQSVYGGDPQAPVGSDLHNKYDEGVRLGSFGMSLYSFACCCYSLVIEKLVQRFRAKKVYVIGQLVYSVGMAGMAASRSKVAVILLSPSAGIMYATLFTMPYLLVAHYHTRGLFSHGDSNLTDRKQVRGLGTDVAIISSMVFLAQFILSVVIGTVVTAIDSTVAVIIASSILSCLGALTATQVTYLDL